MILYEKEILDFLNLPAIPKREWDGKSSFKVGVAVVDLQYGGQAYAVATFDAANNARPRIKKVFGIDWFVDIAAIYVVPSYMDNNVEEMDLDSESKKKAQQILDEAKEIENEGVEEENPLDKLPEWIFDEIHNREEAEAWLKNWNYRNHIKKGRIPQTEESLKLRLYAIYSELQNKKRK